MKNIVYHNDGENKFVKLGWKITIVFGVLLLIGILSMGYVFVQASSWAVDQFQSEKNAQANSVGFFEKISRGITGDDKNNSNQTIKVVSEESQVVKVVEKTSPAVVSIVASKEVSRLINCGNPFYRDVPQQFKKFFNLPDTQQNCERSTEKVKVGAGTGFLVSADGYIVTNKHVVSNTDAEYTVILNDKKNKDKKVKAKVMARDPSHDIAVLKIDKKNLPYIEFGSSENLKVGQTAIAIGFALGEFDNTVSKGVISGLSRNITAVGNGSAQKLRGLIQTDAAINLGNSGGPLLNSAGQAIGMNVATTEAQNIGFAVPVKDVKEAYKETKKTGKISKEKVPFLGVRYVPVDSTIKQRNNLPYDYGALIIRGRNPSEVAVVPGSPADKADITENDIILELEGKKINERNPLSELIRDQKIGQKVKIKLYSDGEEETVTAKLESK